MPYLEILAAPLDPAVRRALAGTLTAGLSEAFAIAPDIITIYFVDIAPGAIAHAGVIDPAPQRLFAKLHAYARDIGARRRAAAALTGPLASAYGLPATAIALYFLDRAADEVAHGGQLSADMSE